MVIEHTKNIQDVMFAVIAQRFSESNTFTKKEVVNITHLIIGKA